MAMRSEEQLLLAHEAACVTGVPPKTVRRIIDAGSLRDFAEKQNGKWMIFMRALVGLKLAYETTDILTLEDRRWFVRRVLECPDAGTVREEVVSVDVGSMKNDVKQRIASLEKAKKLLSATRTSWVAHRASKARGSPSISLRQCEPMGNKLLRFLAPTLI